MKKGFWLLIVLVCFMTPRLVVAADAPVVVDVPPLAPAPLDIVTLKDGSIRYGEVIAMEGGILHLKTPAGPDNLVKVKWESIAKLSVSHPIPFHLKEGTVLIGTATEGPDGTVTVRAEPMKARTMEVPLDSITALNPMIQAPVIYSGTLTCGYSQATGNSQTKNGSLLGDFVARGEQLRLTLNGRHVYSHITGVIGTNDCSDLFPKDDTYQAVVNVPGRLMLDIMYLRTQFNWDIQDHLRLVYLGGAEDQDRESAQDMEQSLNAWDQAMFFLPGTGS